MVQTRSSSTRSNRKSSKTDKQLDLSPPKISSSLRKKKSKSKTGSSTKKTKSTSSVTRRRSTRNKENIDDNEKEISEVRDLIISVSEEGEDVDQAMRDFSESMSPLMEIDEQEEEEEEEEEKVAVSIPLHVFSHKNRMEQAKGDGGFFPFEFGGPIGSMCVVVGLPFVMFYLHALCLDPSFEHLNSSSHCIPPILSLIPSSPQDLLNLLNNLFSMVQSYPYCEKLWNPTAVGMFVGWFSFQILLERALPGEVVINPSSGLKYKLNGHLAFWVTLALLFIGYFSTNQDLTRMYFHAIPFSAITDLFLPLMATSIVFSFTMSTFLYIASFCKPGCCGRGGDDGNDNTTDDGKRILAKGGESGHPFYDFFIGRELNPRCGSLDWKFVCELRPGLIGWVVLNLCFLAKQYETLGYITPSMFLINVFQGMYVWDALHYERAILSTTDITTDGFGFMLCFGDLSWVPFVYSLQARFIMLNSSPVCIYTMIASIVLHFGGYIIFRGANSEKDAFRRNPDAPEVAHLSYLTTKRGRKLITSGWWGMARKINYTGDWMMGLSWCLLCGTSSFVPYFYAIYFAILLIDRAIRDNKSCKEKYGDDWEKYTQEVPSAFVPGLL